MLRIKEAREARGWTQERLAMEMNTTQQTIQRWETGQTDPKASVIKEISRILGITVSFIMNVDEQQKESDLSIDEQKLIEYYRMSSERSQEFILSTAKVEWLLHLYETGGDDALAAVGYRFEKI